MMMSCTWTTITGNVHLDQPGMHYRPLVIRDTVSDSSRSSAGRSCSGNFGTPQVVTTNGSCAHWCG